MLLLLVPGLGLDDVLLGVGEDYLPNLGRVLEQGTLVESVEPEDDVLYTPAETAQALTRNLDCPILHSACLGGDPGLPIDDAELCPAALTADAALDAWLDSLNEVLDQVEPLLTQAEPGCRMLLLDGLLSLETGFLLAHSAQPGYNTEAALAYAALWNTALRALDTGLGRLLRDVNLSSWTVMLASTCDAWAVHTRLDPAEILGPTTVLAGGALLQSDGGLALPEGETWQQVRIGRDPTGQGGVRLQAPPGYAFALTDDSLPRAVPQPGAFLLGLGKGLARGAGTASMTPDRAAGLLRDLQTGEAGLAEGSGV